MQLWMMGPTISKIKVKINCLAKTNRWSAMGMRYSETDYQLSNLCLFSFLFFFISIPFLLSSFFFYTFLLLSINISLCSLSSIFHSSFLITSIPLKKLPLHIFQSTGSQLPQALLYIFSFYLEQQSAETPGSLLKDRLKAQALAHHLQTT